MQKPSQGTETREDEARRITIRQRAMSIAGDDTLVLLVPPLLLAFSCSLLVSPGSYTLFITAASVVAMPRALQSRERACRAPGSEGTGDRPDNTRRDLRGPHGLSQKRAVRGATAHLGQRGQHAPAG
ncbi:hypothetical protein KIL84_005900 [Mauremys mutica]|uniref:Uncharacterized protein n=1 Tax=Mauremys mutica TaxID=74926 RepID=A0A9D4B4E6_9SAUR|nr:hypothetical protein KIL84_005900 [Mauremys mutica]